MHGEMGFQDGIIRYLKNHPGQFVNMTSYGNDNPHRSTAEIVVIMCLRFHLVPSGWFYQNQLRCAQAMEQFYLPAADTQDQTFDAALIRQADAAVQVERQNLGPFNILESLMLPALGSAAKKFAYAQSSTDLARLACALERYRISHGQYPESLDALAPQYVNRLPHDIVGGAALTYHPTVDGEFLLYSVGWNKKDDGGIAAFKKDGLVDTDNGDWVWPQLHR
jgi:hypothetical protein